MLSITLICERGSVETVQQMGMGHCYLLSQNKNETSITEDSNISQPIKKRLCHFHGSHTLNELKERLFVKNRRRSKIRMCIGFVDVGPMGEKRRDRW